MPKRPRPKTLLTEPIHSKYLRMLERASDIVKPVGFSEAEFIDAVRDCDAIVIRTKGAVTRAVMKAAPKLKVVARHGVGLDHIDLDAARELGIQVVYTPAGSLTAVAEHTWMMILGLAKHVRRADASVRASSFAFRDKHPSLQLEGKTLGILGLGRIGGKVAEIGARAFGMKVLYTDLLRFPAKERRTGARKVSLAKLLSSSDVLSVHLPLDPSTRGILGAKEFARMKPGALLVNCARGALVDQPALAEALTSGHLGGAGIDVFDPEVPPPDHPLLGCETAILSPHNAAQTEEARLNYAAVVEDVLRVLSGKKPKFPAY